MKRWVAIGALLLLSLMLGVSCTQKGSCAVSAKVLYVDGTLYYPDPDTETLYAFDGEKSEKTGDFIAGPMLSYEGDLLILGRDLLRFDPKTGETKTLAEGIFCDRFFRMGDCLYFPDGIFDLTKNSWQTKETIELFDLLTCFYSDEQSVFAASADGRLWQAKKDGTFTGIADYSSSEALEDGVVLEKILFQNQKVCYLALRYGKTAKAEEGKLSLLETDVSLGCCYDGNFYGFGETTARRNFSTYATLYRVDPNTGEKAEVYPDMLMQGDAVYDPPGVFAGPYYLVTTIHKPLLSIDRDLSGQETAGTFSVIQTTSYSGQVDKVRYALVLDLRTGEVILLNRWQSE